MDSKVWVVLCALGIVAAVVNAAANGFVMLRGGRTINRKDDPLRFWVELLIQLVFAALMVGALYAALMPFAVQGVVNGNWRVG